MAKNGLISKLIIGSEKSEGQARASLPSNRFELFWDIFKSRFGKLVIINLLMFLFVLPVFLLFVVKYGSLVGYASYYPFMQVMGIGYQAPASMQGFSEAINLSANLSVFLYMPIAMVIAGIGISGGAYVIRNMVWTEGIFVSNDFWKGIKQNFKQIAVICFILGLEFYLLQVATAYYNQMIALGNGKVWLINFAKVLMYIFFVFSIIVGMHAITMCTTYNLSFWHLIKNSVLVTVGFLPHNLLFIILALAPFVLLAFGGILGLVGIIAIILFGLSFVLLVWTDYSHWIYDKHINDKVGAKKNRGMYEKVKEDNSEALKQYREQIAVIKTNLNSRPIKPITDDELTLHELPTSFSRKDLEALSESKKAIKEDSLKYVKEHEDDEEFKKFKVEEKDDEREKRIEKAKKALNKRKR